MASSGNFCTMNPFMGLDDDGTSKLTFSNGNLRAENTANGIQTMGTMAVKSGKWYYEERYDADANVNDARLQVGVQALGNFSGLYDGEIYIKRRSTSSRSQGTHVYYLRPNYQGGKLSHPTSLSWDYGNDESGSSNTGIRVNAVGDIYMIALDLDNYKFYIGRNGTWYSNNTAGATGSNTDITQVDGWAIESTWQGSFWTPVLWIAGASSGTAGYFNFGQDSTFGGQETAGGNADANGFGDFKYSVPSGYQAWTTANLPISDDIDPAQTDSDYPSKQFNTVLYTGNGGTNAITGLGFKPDLVWLKRRDSSASHQLYDSSRGTGKLLSSNNTDAEQTVSTGVNSFDTDGFTLGSAGGANASGGTFVAWCWRANGGTTASNSDGSITTTLQVGKGFSIGTYTGTGSNATVGHGLGAVPDFTIFRERGTAGNWVATSQKNMSSNDHNLYLQLNNAQSDGNYFQNGTAMTSTVISIGTHADINGSSNTYVMYNWINVEGYQKFGTYTANGSSDFNAFVYTGFRPRLIFIKRIDSSAHWYVYDTARETSNPIDDYIEWSSSSAENTNYQYQKYDFLSNGFRVIGNNNIGGSNGGTYIYGAWGDVPFKYNNTF
jgi:hypothetical protein